MIVAFCCWHYCFVGCDDQYHVAQRTVHKCSACFILVYAGYTGRGGQEQVAPKLIRASKMKIMEVLHFELGWSKQMVACIRWHCHEVKRSHRCWSYRWPPLELDIEECTYIV